MKNLIKARASLVTFPLSALSLAISGILHAQDAPAQETAKPQIANPLEEMLILGRQQSAAQDLVLERMEFDAVVDLLGADQIARVGDSNVAAALRRVPGVTLVNGKFIYVRGLGERYSSTALNGAAVPSPDLTRNVIPLDIFPASIVESLVVQKGFTADQSAAFGGGSVNIRTIGLPDQFVFGAEVSGGINTDSDEYLSYNGGGDDDLGTDDGTRALPSEISEALRTFAVSPDSTQFDLSPTAIQNTAARSGSPITAQEAALQNAQLAATLNRDLDLEQESSSIQDTGFGIGLGNLFDVGNNFAVGVMGTLNYDNSVRASERIQRTIDSPSEEFSSQDRSVQNVSIAATFNAGVRWGDDHEIASKNLFIRNTDDDTISEDLFNTTAGFSSGLGFRNFGTRYEERELEVYQFTGKHILGFDTRDALGIGDSIFDDMELNWFYSDSEATTDIPNESVIQADFVRDRDTNEISDITLVRAERALNLRFTELEDTVESSGFTLKLPFEFGDWSFELIGGAQNDQKARRFEQLDLGLGSRLGTANSVFTDSIADTFADENLLNQDLGFELSYLAGNSRSYVAATATDAAFGQISVDWNETWDVIIGARYEDYRQFSAPFQPYRQNGSRVLIEIDEDSVNAGNAPDGVFQDDNVYPTFGITYSHPGFWADDFSLRFNYSETVVRPDLREITDTSYRDPLTDILVFGNASVTPTDFTNFDIRADWFFGNGRSLSITYFYKELENPIEFFQGLGTEASITAEIQNAESAEINGFEFEWLADFGFLGDLGALFFVTGNITLLESELNTGNDLLLNVTNRQRALTGASDFVGNVQLGYDSDDGKHQANLAYNTFSERIFTAGVGGIDDAFEQPFESVDFTYSFFLNDNFTFKFKAQNLLDDSVLITQEDFNGNSVDIFEESVGQTYSLGFSYKY